MWCVFAASRGSGEAAATNQGDDLQTENKEDEGHDSLVMFQRLIRVALDVVDLNEQVGNFFGRHFDCTPQLKSIDTRAIVKRATHPILHRSSSCTVTHSPVLLSCCTIPFAQLVPTNRFRSGRSPPQRRRAVIMKFWRADGAQRIPQCNPTQPPRAATGSRPPRIPPVPTSARLGARRTGRLAPPPRCYTSEPGNLCTTNPPPRGPRSGRHTKTSIPSLDTPAD